MRLVAVERGVGKAPANVRLFPLQRLYARRQGLEFLGFGEAELARARGSGTFTRRRRMGIAHARRQGARIGNALPVRIAARILAPAPAAFRGNVVGDHVVEEHPIVAYQQHCAGVVLQQVLQQFQRIYIQIVGRLVQHQQVRRLAEQARQQQAVAFAAGERLDRGAGALRGKEEIAEVGHHVPSRTVDFDVVRSRCNGLRHGGFFVQPGAELVVIGHAKAAAAADTARVRRDLSQDQFDQRGLADAVRSDQADLVAAKDAAGEILDYAAPVVALGDMLEFGHQFTRAPALGQCHRHLALAVAARRALLAQPFETAHPALVAGAARFDAFADPHFFLRQQLVELCVAHRLCRKLLRLAPLVIGETARIDREPAAVELDDAGDHAVEKRAIVRHDQHGARESAQRFLKPFDRIEVEMVGRFIEHQQFRIGDQRARQCHALAGAAGKRFDAGIRRQHQSRQHRLHPALHVPAIAALQFLLCRLHGGHCRLVVG